MKKQKFFIVTLKNGNKIIVDENKKPLVNKEFYKISNEGLVSNESNYFLASEIINGEEKFQIYYFDGKKAEPITGYYDYFFCIPFLNGKTDFFIGKEDKNNMFESLFFKSRKILTSKSISKDGIASGHSNFVVCEVTSSRFSESGEYRLLMQDGSDLKVIFRTLDKIKTSGLVKGESNLFISYNYLGNSNVFKFENNKIESLFVDNFIDICEAGVITGKSNFLGAIKRLFSGRFECVIYNFKNNKTEVILTFPYFSDRFLPAFDKFLNRETDYLIQLNSNNKSSVQKYDGKNFNRCSDQFDSISNFEESFVNNVTNVFVAYNNEKFLIHKLDENKNLKYIKEVDSYRKVGDQIVGINTVKFDSDTLFILHWYNNDCNTDAINFIFSNYYPSDLLKNIDKKYHNSNLRNLSNKYVGMPNYMLIC